MLIQRKALAAPAGPAGNQKAARGSHHRTTWCRAGVLAAVLAAGCAGGHAAPRRSAAVWPQVQVLSGAAAVPPGSLVRVPHADYSSAASVAAAFYVAWASTDAVHDGPETYIARCAPLVTAKLERQLAASQPASAAWQELSREQTVSLVQVKAVLPPAGASAPTPQVADVRVYATRITTSTAGRAVSSDGITLQLARSGGRWLVSAILFY